ncbi:unnamed protein product [Paramecium sonneborni]|uniref:Kinesin motor domain-containing protein n=1 Tax=Paramecium sonneborni TaxID=65129 RepID=A0A8S1R4J5_9CILI|nr:unnamed protein product [Paramecium sonneborni]
MNYQIFLRIRNYEYVNPIFKVEEFQITLKTPGTKQTEKFIFDNIYQDATTDDIVKEIGFEQLNKVIIVYGQTGSGKSFTLFGDIQNPGIMPLIIKKLLVDKHQLKINYKFIGLDMQSNYVTDDMTQISIFDMETVWEYLAAFSKQKRKEHLIVTLIINQKDQIKFLDLAGPERQTKDLSEPQKYQEAIWATQQLQVLGKCLNSFSKGKIQSLEDSKLTQQLGFNLNTQTILIGTIYPTNSNYDETLSTLQYIDRTRNAIQFPRKASVRTLEISKTQTLENQVKMLEYENKDLKAQMQRLQQEQNNKLKTLKDILCIEFDLDNLNCLSFKEIQQYKIQQEALIANQNLQIQLNEQQTIINQLKQEISQLKQDIKDKQDKWQNQLVEQKYKNFKMNEQFEEFQITLKTPGTKQTEKFIFDNIYQDATTDDIVKEIGFEQLNKVIIVYGQTGSGKSFTLFGDIQNPGIMPLIIKKLLVDKHQLKINYKFIGLDMQSNYVTDDMTQISIFDMETVWEYLAAFSKQKRKEHLIVTLIINQKDQIKFLDLAGPERQTKDLSEPQKYQEAIWATQQLQVLGKCLNSFSKGKIQSLEDSKLTQQLGFNLNTQTILIGTIYPTNSNYDETLSTLQYIDRTRNAIQFPRKASVRTLEISKTQTLENQVKMLEYENKDLKAQMQRLQQEQNNKLKTLKDILCIEFDLDNLNCLSFKEIQQYKIQQEALIANQNLQIQLNEQQTIINQLKQEISQLKQDIKDKQDKWQNQLVEQKYKNFKMNEQCVTQKTLMSEMMRQMQLEKEICIKNVIENSNQLLDEKTNKLFQLPINANLKQLDNIKIQELKKQVKTEMEQDLLKQLAQMKIDNQNNLQQMKQMHDNMLKDKNNEMDQFISQYKMYRDKKKNVIKEMKEEMLQMYEIMNRYSQLINKIENGQYSSGNKIITIPRKDKPVHPSQSQFKHLNHFLERKKSFEIQNKKSSSAEKSFLLTPINRVQRSQTTFQDKPIIVNPSDIELFNINEMDIPELRAFIVKLKELLKKEQNENKIKSEKQKQELAELKKDREEIQAKYNVESKKYNLQRVTIESQNRLLTKLRPTSSLLRKQS